VTPGTTTPVEWRALYEQERAAHADARRILHLEVQRLRRLLERCASHPQCPPLSSQAGGIDAALEAELETR
jgi:hypothetical protein